MKKLAFVDEFTLKGVCLTWASTLVLSFFHIFTSFKLTQISCERYLVAFNATCAATVLLFGSVVCLSASLGIPIKILGQILQRASFNSIKDNHYMDLISTTGLVLFAILSAFTPLIGFFKAISASMCRELGSVYYYSTVALNCLDVFFMACVTWVLMRRREFEVFRKNVEYNTIKLKGR